MMKMRKKMETPKRTIRFTASDEDLEQVINAAAVLGIEPMLINNFYAVLTFPEPYDIIIITNVKDE